MTDTERVQAAFDGMAYLMACGMEFQRARLARGLSRERLAELSGVHVNTIGSLERGEHDINSTTKCWILAALGCKSIVMEDGFDSIVLNDEPGTFPRIDIQDMPDSCIIRIIGQVLRERREQVGLTLHQVARLAGIHHNTLWNIERGLVSTTGINLHKIYRALDVHIVTPGPDGIILG